MPTPQEVFVLADRALAAVVAQISGDRWDLLFTGHQSAPEPQTLRFVVNYHAYDDAWVPAMLAGRTMDEVDDLPARGDDILGADPVGVFASTVEQACAAAAAVTDLAAPVHTSFGDFSTHDYLLQVLSFRGLRAVDISRTLGIDDALPEALVRGMWDLLSPVADEWRTIGVFRAAVPVEDDAPLQARLMALTGREPFGRSR